MKELQEFIRLARECYYSIKRNKYKTGRSKYTSRFDSVGANGWCVIGSGFYGVALKHLDYPYVLKISGRAGYGFACPTNVAYDSKRLDAWPVFAEHCKNNPHPNLPQILHLERVSESMTWAVMPQYYKYKGDVWERNNPVYKIRDALKGNATCPEWLWPVRQMANGLYFEVDLHGNNVMQDYQGNMIILDPFSTTGAT